MMDSNMHDIEKESNMSKNIECCVDKYQAGVIFGIEGCDTNRVR